MTWFRTHWNSLAWRKMAIMLVSGISIVIAFTASWAFDAQAVRAAFMILAAVVAGSDIAIRAINALQRRQITIELLVTIAAVGALIIGEYWESAAVTFLLIFGAWLEARTIAKTRSSLATLLNLAPSTAMVIRDSRSVEVDLADVTEGDHVLIRPGESIPVDGTVLEGVSAVNEAAITGEPIPVVKSPGSTVFTGTVSQDASLTVIAERVGADSLLGTIISRVEEAQEAKAPVQTTIEKFAKWYTPAIILLAGIIWLVTRDTHLALTILVIGCPGALVIATPVAFVAGIGRAASLGILVKGGEFLESISKVTTLALDKTGTLTMGEPTLTDTVPLAGTSETELITLAAIAERGSTHPLARPIVAAAQARGIDIPHATEMEAVVGKGVTARHDDTRIAVGSPSLMESIGASVSGAIRQRVADFQAEGRTVALVGVDDRVIGMLAVQDVARPNMPRLLHDLRSIGVGRVTMLTGDNERTAAAVAAAVGITEVHANLLPEDKLTWVKAEQQTGAVVAMVGDGINDSPALAAADVSIAMGAAGTDVALDTANIALMNDDPMRIVDALRVSRKTNRVITQNLVIAIGTVALLLTGVLLRQVHMAGGMMIHELSVMVVILNAMRLMRA